MGSPWSKKRDVDEDIRSKEGIHSGKRYFEQQYVYVYELSTNALPFSMFFLSSGKHAASSFSSSADKGPSG